jgi:hypothetical protein
MAKSLTLSRIRSGLREVFEREAEILGFLAYNEKVPLQVRKDMLEASVISICELSYHVVLVLSDEIGTGIPDEKIKEVIDSLAKEFFYELPKPAASAVAAKNDQLLGTEIQFSTLNYAEVLDKKDIN